MEQGIKTYIVRFDNRASLLYSDIFSQFILSLEKTNRTNNENIYKMQEAKYLLLLKKSLDKMATELLEENEQKPYYSLLHSALSSKIGYYLQEFRHKSSSL